MNVSQANQKTQIRQEIISVLVATALGIFLFMLASTFIPEGVLTNKGQFTSLIVVAVLVLQNLLILAPIYLFAVKKNKLTWADFGFRSTDSIKSIFYIFAAFFIFFAAMISVTSIQQHYGIEIPGMGEQIDKVTLFGDGIINKIISAITIIILAPILEEIIFRGYFYERMRKVLPIPLAIVVAGSMFGLIHLEPSVAIPLSFLGILICILYEKTNSIWPAIAFHVINNGIAFWVTQAVG